MSNGNSKEGGEYEYMQGHQAYGAAQQMNSPNADPYMSSYYTPQYMFPNMNQDGVSGGAWSNGGDPMSFLGGYSQMSDQYMSGNNMYGGFEYQFNWGFPAGDFNTWGSNPQQGGRKDEHGGVYAGPEAYYGVPQRDGYGAMNGELETQDQGVRAVDIGMKNISINDKGDGREPVHNAHHSSHQNGSSSGSSSGGGVTVPSGAPKRMTWASIASQPARPQPQVKPKSIPRAPLNPGRHNMDIGTWDGKNSGMKQGPSGQPGQRTLWTANRGNRTAPPAPYSQGPGPHPGSSNSQSGGSYPKSSSEPTNATLEKLKSANQYNPKELTLNVKNARYFIIKSYSEDDIHRSIKYGIWCSTEHGNKRLDAAYRERDDKGPVYFFFSVNGSGHFCGMAQMMSNVDYTSSSSVWAQSKWKGQIEVKWIYVKDVPNSQLRHIRLENNENKPVTNSRDTQEVPPEKGKQVLKIIHHYRHTTSIFDDFSHYEKRQEDDVKPRTVIML